MIQFKYKTSNLIIVNVTKRTFGTKSSEGDDSLPLTSDHEKASKRKVPVASGRAFREQKRKQESVKVCLKRLRSLIAIEEDKHQARVCEYNALRAQGLWPDPVRQPNLLRVFEIILEVSEEDEKELIESNSVIPTKTEFSFLHIKTKHSFNLVDPSPWPLLASLGVFMLTTGSVLYMQKFIGGSSLLVTALILIIFVMFTWWREIIREATFEEQHTFVVQRGLRLGMVLFIVSEIMFFFVFFWAFFHLSLSPTFNIGGVWPPLGTMPIKTLSVPLALVLILFVMFTWRRGIIRKAAFEHRFVVLAGSSLVLLLFSIATFGAESPIFCSSCDLRTCIACFTRMMKSLCKGNSPKLRGEDFIPQNAEGMWVYIAIFYVVGLSIEYIFYRLEQRAKLASEENASEENVSGENVSGENES